uniref:Lipocalin n=1 Tax=Rhipicephalus appendiculatus TaxID=34631 RepID=A0A131Z7J9_RHIAP
MASLTGLILWALTSESIMATKSPFHLPDGVNLSRYHEPWRAVTLDQPIYLFRVSDETRMNTKGLCIRSRHLKGTKQQRMALRTLDFYSANTGSTNISIDARKNDVIYVNVTSEPENFIFLNLPGLRDGDLCTGQYEFSVLFGDNRCLLLETRKLESSGTYIHSTRHSCSLWMTEFGLKERTGCCVFMFSILCGRGVQVFKDSCHKDEK